MENNQHSSGQSASQDATSNHKFSNQQPGQQLPAHAANKDENNAQPTSAEQHSESSKPGNENETLGTP